MRLNRFAARLPALLALLAVGLAPVAALAQSAGVAVDVKASIEGSYFGATDINTPTFPIDLKKSQRLTPGTGTGKADKLYAASRTLSASATESLDLAGGLADPLGATLTFVKVKTIMVIAATTNTNNVVIGGAGSNGFTGAFVDATDKISIPPGGMILLTHPGAGWSVTASTGDILLVANSSGGTAVTYRLVILGATA